MERDFTYDRVLTRVQLARQQLELAINATPTGLLRNKLTEANIYLMVAESETIALIRDKERTV